MHTIVESFAPRVSGMKSPPEALELRVDVVCSMFYKSKVDDMWGTHTISSTKIGCVPFLPPFFATVLPFSISCVK